MKSKPFRVTLIVLVGILTLLLLCLVRGLQIGPYDPGPENPWHPTYGARFLDA